MIWKMDGCVVQLGRVGDVRHIINSVQRGLSTVNLTTPSIGGTMNIITDPALEKGGKFKQEIGDGGFLKTTFNYNTGFSSEINSNFKWNNCS